MNNLVGPCQASFLKNRQASDNGIIVQELISYFRRMKDKKENMVMKIDLEKGFDKIEWSFVKYTLHSFNFPPKIISIIMSCISTIGITILVNGSRTEFFEPSRGIRQDDPLSPYIFILCMECLSNTINNSIKMKYWKPVKIVRKGPALSHLFFVDDLVLISKAELNSCKNIENTLQIFCDQSVQTINQAKSKIMFSNNCSKDVIQKDVIQTITRVMGFNQSSSFGKYLGFPITQVKITHQDFQFILDNLQSKMDGWKTNFLNITGRTTLAKACLNSIQTYIMQLHKLPISITKKIDKIQRNFIWGTTDTKRKLHMLNWNVITENKDIGGLGIQ